MSIEGTGGYIDRCIKLVHRDEKLFSDAAKIEIYKRTHGIARLLFLLTIEDRNFRKSYLRKFLLLTRGNVLHQVGEITTSKSRKLQPAGNMIG